MDNDSNILDDLAFEPEDSDAFELANLIASNRAFADRFSGVDLSELYILAGIEAIKCVLAGSDEMNDQRIAIDLRHEQAFRSTLEVLRMNAEATTDDDDSRANE